MSVTLGDGEREGAGPDRVVALRPAGGARGKPRREIGPMLPGVGPACTAVGHPAAVPTSAVVGRALAAELDDLLDALTDQGPVPPLRVELADLLDAWASALVGVHRRVVDAGRRPVPLPWVLREDPVPAWATELPAVAGSAWAVRAHPSTRRAVSGQPVSGQRSAVSGQRSAVSGQRGSCLLVRDAARPWRGGRRRRHHAEGAPASLEDHEWLAALWARPLGLVTGATHLP